MNEIKHFTDLEAWQVNHQVVIDIYKITKEFPKEERYGITDQLRRACVSITSNIAEGWGYYHFSNKVRYYYQSKGSSCEVQNLIIVSHDLKLLNDEDYEKLKMKVFRGYKLINGLIRSVEKNKKI